MTTVNLSAVITVVNAEMLFVEDETEESSRAMVVKTNAKVSYTKDSAGYEQAKVSAEGFRLVVFQLSSGVDVCRFVNPSLVCML